MTSTQLLKLHCDPLGIICYIKSVFISVSSLVPYREKSSNASEVKPKYGPYSPFQVSANNKTEFFLARFDDLVNWGRKVNENTKDVVKWVKYLVNSERNKKKYEFKSQNGDRNLNECAIHKQVLKQREHNVSRVSSLFPIGGHSTKCMKTYKHKTIRNTIETSPWNDQ